MHYTKPKLITLIHVAKNQLRLDELTYRQLLKRLTGKDSTKSMLLAELMIVLENLKKSGFKIKPTPNKSPTSKEATVKHNIALKIRAEWIQMHQQGIVKDGSETALNTFVRNLINPVLKKQGSNRIILNVQSLDYQNGTIVLERLKKWKKRENNQRR